MRPTRFLPLSLIVAATAVACGGEPPAEEPAAQAAPETVAAPATSVCYIAEGTPDDAKARPSPLRETSFTVGGVEGTLCYGAPSAKGRQIMGALVPFGEPWRLGANEPTTVHVTAPTQVGGIELQPGSYSLYAVPGEKEWTFYLNSAYERWGIPIDEEVRAADIGSFVAPIEATEAPVETLTFRFEAASDGATGELVMEWEGTRVRIPVRPSPAGVPAM